MADRALGNPLGNPLALQRDISQAPDPLLVDLVTGAGDFIIPAGYTRARITAVGGGGAGGRYNYSGFGFAGGGGGCTRSGFIPVSAGALIRYVIGPGGVPSATPSPTNNGGTTTAQVGNIELIALGGQGGTTGLGGTASGGVSNYAGGNGVSSGGGGGAAGIDGTGGNGSGSSSALDTGSSAGAGGRLNGGGGGICGASNSASGVPTIWGGKGKDAVAGNGGDGGAWGGGGGCSTSQNLPSIGGAGGHGGMRVELW